MGQKVFLCRRVYVQCEVNVKFRIVCCSFCNSGKYVVKVGGCVGGVKILYLVGDMVIGDMGSFMCDYCL